MASWARMTCIAPWSPNRWVSSVEPDDVGEHDGAERGGHVGLARRRPVELPEERFDRGRVDLDDLAADEAVRLAVHGLDGLGRRTLGQAEADAARGRTSR